MYVRHLSLTNFRNYARLELDLPCGVVVVCGDNAAGKSNLLEALYYLATTKSFRASSDHDLIHWMVRDDPLPFFRLVAELEREGHLSRLEMAASEDGKPSANGGEMARTEGSRSLSKRLKVNGAAKRALEFIGLANAVMFSPQDLELIDGAPLIRRRYLDVTISQVDSRYVRALAHYNRVLTRRNHLLRLLRDHHGSPDELTYWDQELARAGAYIVSRRRETVSALSRLEAEIHRRLTDSQERLRAIYRSSLDLSATACAANGDPDAEAAVASRLAALPPEGAGEGLDEAGLRDAFLSGMQRGRSRDIVCGASLVGPHRDDITFLLDDRPVSVYASRGQQRTVALGLKLAETEYLRERTGEPPILLLDDVLSELDRDRRHHVLSVIEPGQQVVITTTDLDQLEPAFLQNSTLLRVERGAVSPILLPA